MYNGGMFKRAQKIQLDPEEKINLNRLVKSGKTSQKIVLRAQVILQAAEGISNNASAKKLGVSRPTVILWRQRFLEKRIYGLLKDAEGRGRKKSISEEKVKEIVEATLHTKPKGATHWSTRTLGKEQRVSKMTVQRIWKQHGLQPHRIETFKLSNDKHFVEKLRDVVGLYLNPPEKAVVFSVDEKSQIQALDRTQPGLPMKKGRCGTITHDYKRHGTTTLFAALNMLNGKVIGECLPRHRSKEFIRFLKNIDKATDRKLELHLIVDNYSTHKTDEVKNWLKKHPRFNLHFTPTGSSWLNMVERWFREITEKRIRRGIFQSVPQLIDAIDEFLAVHNENPKIFVWKKDADTILAKVNNCKAISEALH
jgi:transposase